MKRIVLSVFIAASFGFGLFADDFVKVEGGEFLMGKSGVQFLESVVDGEKVVKKLPEDNDAYDDEIRHSVKVSDFYISKYEVTQTLYKKVMEKNPSFFSDRKDWKKRPVEFVSWYDAVKFCNEYSRLSGLPECYKIEGKKVTCDFSLGGYRLPTEAEWEYAARGGKKADSGKFSGDTEIENVAWYWDNAGKETHEVGKKKRNKLGLYDMNGNVSEWCFDLYSPYDVPDSSSKTIATAPSAAPSFKKSSENTEISEYRVFRGGSWAEIDRNCRTSVRFSADPNVIHDHLGFRLVRTAVAE